MDFTGHTSAFWNDRYGAEDYTYGTAPNGYLVSQAYRLRPGMSAFVPGDGEGRNGVWLAEQGLDVHAVDLSTAGLAKARRLAHARGVAIRTEQVDLTRWAWPRETFDVVAAVYLHLSPDVRPQVHRAMLETLRPGGLVILAAFRPEQLAYRERYGSGGPPQATMLYSPEMLRDDFAEADVLELEETVTKLQEGVGHSGEAAVIRAVFQRSV